MNGWPLSVPQKQIKCTVGQLAVDFANDVFAAILVVKSCLGLVLRTKQGDQRLAC